MVRLRLQRHGRKKRPFYHIVAADHRAPRDGKFIERLGWYNPNHETILLEVNRDRVLYWLQVGAQPSDTVRSLLSKSGVLYYKHLLRGVEKGAHTQETADRLYDEWMNARKNDENRKVVLNEWYLEETANAREERIAQAKQRNLALQQELDKEKKAAEEAARQKAMEEAKAEAAKTKAAEEAEAAQTEEAAATETEVEATADDAPAAEVNE